MTKQKKSSLMDDHDDAHFDGNPAYKRGGKRRYIGMGTKSRGRHNVVYAKGASTRRSQNGKTTARKRVAGK